LRPGPLRIRYSRCERFRTIMTVGDDTYFHLYCRAPDTIIFDHYNQ
jgi:hypothetical protein